MAKDGFWGGFGLGAVTGVAAGIAGFVAASGRASSYDEHILRLERSVQIGRPAEEVFAAWSRFEELPGKISALRQVEVDGERSTWEGDIDGRSFQFDAVVAQVIPNESIGWKSVRGPQHSGRINFARLGDDTLVHVTMNYAPPLGRFGRLLAPITDYLESRIEEALRDFKRALEESPEAGSASEKTESARDAAVERWGRRAPASAGWDETSDQRATGTEGLRARNPEGTPGTHVEDQSGKVENPGAVDYTRPPKNPY
jgi:uncharacterized membrane protein